MHGKIYWAPNVSFDRLEIIIQATEECYEDRMSSEHVKNRAQGLFLLGIVWVPTLPLLFFFFPFYN